HGVDAVIDKDRSALKLAQQSDADTLMVLTDVSNVFINYGKENEIKLENVTVEEMEQYIEDRHFSAGSMLPIIESTIGFVKINDSRNEIKYCKMTLRIKNNAN